MKIGIIGAMQNEIDCLLSCRNFKKHFFYYNNEISFETYIAYIYNVQVIIILSGIGKVSAASKTTQFLMYFKLDFIINIGFVGSLNSLLNRGDIIISTEVSYHDVNLSIFGYKIGQMSQCPVSFKANSSLLYLAKHISNFLNIKLKYGLVISGDIFIYKDEDLKYIKSNFPNALAVDMESAAIAHVCYKFKVPFVAIKIISDHANQYAYKEFKCFSFFSLKKFSYFVIEIIKNLANKQNF